MPNSTFSIITPTYNRVDVLPRAIKSVLNQTFQDFELIIIDDGSTDNTEDIKNLFKNDRIIYNKLSQNKGVNNARNLGLDIAGGRYIIFLDSDDELLPNALEIYLKLWQEIDNEMIGNIVTRCIDGKTKKKIGYLEKESLTLGYEEIICRQKARGEFRSCWKKEAIGNMRFEKDLSAQESVLWWRLAKKWDFFYKDIVTTIYYKDSNLSLCSIDSQVKNAYKMAKGTEILLREHSQIWRECCPKRYTLYLNSAALYNLLVGNKRYARHWLKLSLRQNSFSIKIWVLFFLSFFPKNLIISSLNLQKKVKGKPINSYFNKLFSGLSNFTKNIISNILYYCGGSGLILKTCLKLKPAKLILMYHRITDNNNGMFSGVTLSNFDKQVSALKKYFKFVTLSELIRLNDKTNGSLAVITFDDGYKSTFTKAFPVLKKNRVPATVFLATGAIDNSDLIWTDKLNLLKKEEIKESLKRLPDSVKNAELNNLLSQSDADLDSLSPENKMLSWDDISLMNTEGIEFGAHTVSHPILTNISEEEIEKEIVTSKHKIESVIGKSVTTFSYPNGSEADFNESTKQILKDSGFQCAVTTIEGKVKNNDDNFALKRISLANRQPGLAMLKIIKELLKDV